MGEYSEAFVAFDVSKTKHAVAIADGALDRNRRRIPVRQPNGCRLVSDFSCLCGIVGSSPPVHLRTCQPIAQFSGAVTVAFGSAASSLRKRLDAGAFGLQSRFSLLFKSAIQPANRCTYGPYPDQWPEAVSEEQDVAQLHFVLRCALLATIVSY